MGAFFLKYSSMMSTNYGLDNGNYRDMDGNKGWRLDFDPEKVVHVNIFDFTKGKGLGKAVKKSFFLIVLNKSLKNFKAIK